MTQRSRLAVPALCLFISLAATAQDAAVPSPVQPLGPGLFRAPIHTQPRDQSLGDYGLWASGDTYKASFHDGFVFYPVLGKTAPENLPLRWTTVGVSIGGEPIFEPRAALAPTYTPWRCEYRFGNVTEAYDVLPDGVEQTFIIARRPAGDGDLAIEGAVDSPLTAPPLSPAVQDLVFADAQGTPRIRYGKAAAIDAAGNHVGVITHWDGARVRLVVPGDWIARATFPVTVDPLTTSSPYLTGRGAPADDLTMHHQVESPAQNTMVAFSRAVSAADIDLYVHTGPADLHINTLVFSDVNINWSSMKPDVTWVGGADRWVVAFWRQSLTEDRVRVYFHDRDNQVLNSGVLDTTYNPVGEHASYPSVGGSANQTAGTRAVLVYRMDPTRLNSTESQVHALVVDAAARTVGQRLIVEAGSDAENPDINCQRGAAEDGWVLVYPRRSSTSDDYDVYARRVRAEPILLISNGVDGQRQHCVEAGEVERATRCPEVLPHRGPHPESCTQRQGRRGRRPRIQELPEQVAEQQWSVGQAERDADNSAAH